MKVVHAENGILVIVGDVDPAATMEKVKRDVRQDSEPAVADAAGDGAEAGEGGELSRWTATCPIRWRLLRTGCRERIRRTMRRARFCRTC